VCSECIHDPFDSATSQTAELEILQQQGTFEQLPVVSSPGTMRAWHAMPRMIELAVKGMDGSKATCSDGIL
jgi:hypothetical protein